SDIKKPATDAQVLDEMYVPYRQRPTLTMSLAVRTATSPTLLAIAIRHEVQEVDSTQPIANVKTMDEVLVESRGQPRFTMMLLVIFAGIAFVLAIIGIYGVMSYTVKQRTQEIGIRLALGCQTADVLKLVMSQGVWLIVIGLGLGLVGSFVVTRALGT